jgi:hypothetical protein
MSKEVNGNILIVNGDVLSRADDYDGIEDDRATEPSYDADISGYAQRMATARKYAVSKAETVVASTPVEILENDGIHHNGGIHIPREVLDLLIEAATTEDDLRSKGYSEQRIGTKVGVPLTIKMLHLQLKGIDTSNAFGSSQLDTDDNVSDIEKLRMDKIDKLVDQGMSYDDARRRA